MPFKLNGASFEDALSTTQRIKKFLDNLPFEELVTTPELARALNVASNSRAFRTITNPTLKEYAHRLNTSNTSQNVWGSKKTIQALIQQLQENSNAD